MIEEEHLPKAHFDFFLFFFFFFLSKSLDVSMKEKSTGGGCLITALSLHEKPLWSFMNCIGRLSLHFSHFYHRQWAVKTCTNFSSFCFLMSKAFAHTSLQWLEYLSRMSLAVLDLGGQRIFITSKLWIMSSCPRSIILNPPWLSYPWVCMAMTEAKVWLHSWHVDRNFKLSSSPVVVFSMCFCCLTWLS